MQSAIKVATSKLGLQPGAAFQARVAQLAELVKAHKLVSYTFYYLLVCDDLKRLERACARSSTTLFLRRHVCIFS